MKFLVHALLILHSFVAFGVSFKINSQNQLILIGNSCDEILSAHQSFCDWTKQVDTNFSLSTDDENKIKNSCTPASNNKKQTIITKCLPEFVKHHHSKALYNNGSNCWGTAMGLKKISTRPRFIWSQEMYYWLDSPICKKLKPDEKIMPGDIMNVYGPEALSDQDRFIKDEGQALTDVLDPDSYQLPQKFMGSYTGFHRILHSETFITPEITFGKESPNKDDKFMFKNASEVYGRPRAAFAECQENQNLIPHIREYKNVPKNLRASKCDYFTNVYRCQNFDSYFNGINLTDKQKDILKSVEQLQRLNDQVFNLQVDSNYKIVPAQATLISNIAKITASKALENLAKKGLSKEEEMLLVMEYFSSVSIQKNLKFANIE